MIPYKASMIPCKALYTVIYQIIYQNIYKTSPTQWNFIYKDINGSSTMIYNDFSQYIKIGNKIKKFLHPVSFIPPLILLAYYCYKYSFKQ